MLPIAHLSSGYLVYAAVSGTVEFDNPPLFGVALAGAMAPDIDGLFGAQMKDHKDTVFHAPLFWLGTFAIVYIAGQVLFPDFSSYLIAFFLSTFVHLFLDWMSARTTGVRIFYPFSKKKYSLFPFQPEKGDVPVLPDRQHFGAWREFWKFYFSKKLLVIIELLITVSPFIVYAAFKK